MRLIIELNTKPDVCTTNSLLSCVHKQSEPTHIYTSKQLLLEEKKLPRST